MPNIIQVKEERRERSTKGRDEKYTKNFSWTHEKFKTSWMTSPQVEDSIIINPYPTAFPYGNGMVLHFYQQQESSTTKTVHKVINKGLKTYV